MKLKEEEEEESRRKAVLMNHQSTSNKISKNFKENFEPVKKLKSEFALNNLYIYILIIIGDKYKTKDQISQELYDDFYMSPTNFMLLYNLKRMVEEGFIEEVKDILENKKRYRIKRDGIDFLKNASKYMQALSSIIKHIVPDKNEE